MLPSPRSALVGTDLEWSGEAVDHQDYDPEGLRIRPNHDVSQRDEDGDQRMTCTKYHG